MAYTGSKAFAGRGSVVSIYSGSAFTPISEITKAGFTGSAWGTFDSTNFDSDVNDEFGTTTRNNGECDLECNLVDGDPGQMAVAAAYNSGSKTNFTIQLMPAPGQTTGRLYAFSALVTSADTPIDLRTAVTLSMKLKVSGPVDITPGS